MLLLIRQGQKFKTSCVFSGFSDYRELLLEKSGGLDRRQVVRDVEVPELRIYNDIIPLIAQAIEIISKK